MIQNNDARIVAKVENSGSRGALLEAAGMFDTLIYLRSVEECRKTDLYNGIGRGSEMVPKLDRLEDAGLIRQTKYKRITFLSLTEEGRQVADKVAGIQEIIQKMATQTS